MNINKDFYAKLSTSCLTQLFKIYMFIFIPLLRTLPNSECCSYFKN